MFTSAILSNIKRVLSFHGTCRDLSSLCHARVPGVSSFGLFCRAKHTRTMKPHTRIPSRKSCQGRQLSRSKRRRFTLEICMRERERRDPAGYDGSYIHPTLLHFLCPFIYLYIYNLGFFFPSYSFVFLSKPPCSHGVANAPFSGDQPFRVALIRVEFLYSSLMVSNDHF